MKKVLLPVLVCLGFLINTQAQSTIPSDNSTNSPEIHYTIQLNGISTLAEAKEMHTYDALEIVFGIRPTFNTSTHNFEVNSQEIVTLPDLTAKLNEFGLVPSSFESKPKATQSE